VEPALDPVTVPDHVEDAVHPARAGLAMGLAALGLVDDARALADELVPVDGPALGRRALEALRRGAHARLVGAPAAEDGLDEALAAGLDHVRRSPGVPVVVAAAEAGRPALVLVERTALHEQAAAGRHWVLVTRATDEHAILHDPFEPEGPDTLGWEALAEAMGAAEDRAVLELAKAPREHEV